ncbi:hypothetical protein B0T09DRAFT_327854 [Sordaria sp. MPI-SDFR-AT-0083]|nr:hypothetical protein B0T09DRAFT_327854 [Sordaria sp. MPI-SDFR-AT-0083]
MDSNTSNSSGGPDSDDDMANSPSDHGNNAEPTVTQFQQDQQNHSSSFLPATVFQGSNNNNSQRQQQVKTPEPRDNTTTPTNEPITTTSNLNNNNLGNNNSNLASLYQTLNPIKTSINPTPRNILAAHALSSPSTPGTLPNFDWDDFVTRYTESLSAADAQEQELLEEFQQLVQYFNVWASSSSAHDTDRAVKRLQTRERYVRLSEQNLAQRRKHLTEVVRAFQSALALLSQSS